MDGTVGKTFLRFGKHAEPPLYINNGKEAYRLLMTVHERDLHFGSIWRVSGIYRRCGNTGRQYEQSQAVG